MYVGLETFAANVENTQTYLQIGGYSDNMDVANNLYNNNYNTLYEKTTSIEGADGTNLLAALNGVSNMGTLPAGTSKYVVPITDGAPNQNGVNATTVANAANALKNAGYTVITVGLSTKNVTVAPELLWRAASFEDPTVAYDSDDKTEPKYYYYAESGDYLTWILREIVRTIMKEASVNATITDEIDKLFYPVSKDGTPFDNNATSRINLSGEKAAANAPDAAGKVTYNSTSDTWTVEWQNQEASWGGWKGSVFVKSREDFMSGNNVSTNVSASVVPESYTANKGQINEKTAYFSESDQQEKAIHPATPYVNVDELHMTEHDTEWTVYLGTEVDPAEQLKQLWNEIVINTVVDTDGMNNNYTMKTQADLYYDTPYPGGLSFQL